MLFVRSLTVLTVAGVLSAHAAFAQAPPGNTEPQGEFGPFSPDASPSLIEITPRDRSLETRSSDELVHETERVLKIAAETRAALGKPLEQPAPNDGPLRLVPDDLYLGKVYLVGKQVRYIVLRVWLVNTTNEPITINREDFILSTRGIDLKVGSPPSQQGLARISAGRRVIDLEELSKTGPVTVPPDKAISLPIAFFDLPGVADVPAMTLRLPIGETAAEVDLNDYALGLMDLGIERLGPKGLLALIRVGGEITPVGVGELVEALSTLVNDDAVRIVLAWNEDAPSVPPDISNWLVQSAIRLGGPPVNDGQRPPLPGGLRELHLASLPKGTGVPNYAGPNRVHDSVEVAVAAALEGAYATLPLDELNEEIESGGPLTRAVAVAAGGRLPDEKLPLLLELSGDANEDIARAAIAALREFGSPAAIERLVELAQTGPPAMRIAAVESLASSRFGAAHDALRQLLESSVTGPLTIPSETLVSVLAMHPRPLWSDALYRMAKTGDPSVRADALEALARLGHPELLDLFEEALSDADNRLRARAFALLSSREDRPSEDLALDFTLAHLKTYPPTQEMATLLQRTKDQRAVPLLLTQLRTGNGNRSDLIRLLSQIGGLEVRQVLEEVYPTLDRSIRPQALVTLAQMRSPRFYDFAAAALRSNDTALITAAQQQLQIDGGPEAVDLLIDVLFESDQTTALTFAAMGLAGIGTQKARAALRSAGRSGGIRAEIASREWFKLLAASAGRDSFLAGESARGREEWKEAIEHYTTTLEVDPQFIDAWPARANSHMQLGNFDAARADYEKTLELDGSDTAAITCIGILQVFEGNVEEGLNYVRARAAEFREDELFAYNTACLYAVASERIETENPERAEQLRSDAVKELARSIELGMIEPAEVEWMRKDPDLKSLHGRPDFERVVTDAEGRSKSIRTRR